MFDEINVIVAEGYRDPVSLNTAKPARMCLAFPSSKKCRVTYKAKVVGMLTKLPGWYFTAYQSAQFFSQQLISEVQYRALIEDFLKAEKGARPAYADIIANYNFSSGVPKYKVFVKLNETITPERRDFVANGIRSYFRDDQTILLDLQLAMQAVTSSLKLF